jgi:PAS domain S-box-containing protein
VLDALQAQVALLDAHGVIVAVNASWRRFALANGLAAPAFGVGLDYAALCDAAVGPEAQDARLVAQGIRAVLAGQVPEATLEYPCHAPTRQRWYLMSAAPLAGCGAVVMHIDITERKRAELDRERDQRLLRTLIDALPDLVYTKDLQGRFVTCNLATLVLVGCDTEAELAGKTVFDVLPKAEAERTQADDLRVLAGGAVLDRDEASVNIAGLTQWHRTIKVPLRDAGGQITGLVGISRNITERRRAQQESRELGERLGQTLEALSDGFCTVDRDWRFTYVNRRAARMLRRPRASLLGQTVWQQLPALEGTPIAAALRRAMEQGNVVQIVECLAPLARWYELRLHPTRRGLAVYLRDVSRQHRLAAQFEAEHARLLAAQAVAKVGSWAADLSTWDFEWSDETHRIFETDPATFRPTRAGFRALIHPDDRAAVLVAIEHSLGQRETQVIEHRLLLPSGVCKTVEERWQVVANAQGLPVRALGTCQDITARREAEEGTRALAQRLTSTLESIAEGFYMVDRDWRFTYVNCRAEAILGRARASLLGRVLWEEFKPAIGTEFERQYRRAMATGTAATFEACYGPQASWRRVNCYPTEAGLSVYFRDVTAERAARQQLELLEASVSQLNDIVIITEATPLAEPGPRILFVNEAFVRVTGYARSEVLGRSPRLLQGPRTERAELDRIGSALARFEPVHAELVNYKKGGETYWVEMDIVPVGVDGGAWTHFVAVGRDITERKHDQDALRELNAELEARVRSRTAELNQARDEAERANQTKSAFLATMSHEIRTPMNGVIGMIDVLHQTSLQGYQVEMVDLIRDSAESLLAIVDDILDFSKIEAGKLALECLPMDFSASVAKVCAMLDHVAIKRGVRMSVFVDPAIPQQLTGDETRVRQVLVNLASNAIKFSSGRAEPGRVSVRALLVARTAEVVTVDLTVSDNGIGIEPQTLARLFTRFVQADASTTRRFGGTGLGLAITGTLVHMMGGEISVDSKPGLGSTFSVRLLLGPPDPLAAAAAATVPAAGLQCRIVGGEPQLAADLAAYLRHSGVLVAPVPDLAAAAATAATGLWLWLILPGPPVPALAALRALAPAGHATATRFIVLGHGARRHPRVEAVDLVTLDADALSRRTLERTLALAAGRVQDAAGIDSPRPPGSAAPAPQRHDALRQRRLILVAEDNETNRLVILRQLQIVGFAADVVVDGRAALASWRSGDYALVLTDLHMPALDGYALTAAIRAEEAAGQHIPIIALTANALRDEELRCLDAGMDAYLTKPIRLSQLRTTIEAWLGAGASAAAPRGAAPVAAPAAARASVVDVGVLTALVGNDPAVVASVLQAFAASAAQLSLELRGAVQAGSTQAVAGAAHRFKSGARSIGALRLGEICASVEEAALAGRTEALALLLPRLQTELATVQQVLDSRPGPGLPIRPDVDGNRPPVASHA